MQPGARARWREWMRTCAVCCVREPSSRAGRIFVRGSMTSHSTCLALRTRLRSAKQVLWLVIDPLTKILPALELGSRTQHTAHVLIHSLQRALAPGCIPLFPSDGLNLYF